MYGREKKEGFELLENPQIRSIEQIKNLIIVKRAKELRSCHEQTLNKIYFLPLFIIS